jgi:hypothetical protein
LIGVIHVQVNRNVTAADFTVELQWKVVDACEVVMLPVTFDDVEYFLLAAFGLPDQAQVACWKRVS